MELMNSTISGNPLISPKFSFRPTLINKSPSKLCILTSKKFPPHSPFSPYLSFSSPSRFRISASFRRPTKRQNYLRKKLAEQQQVSRRVLESNSFNYAEKSSTLDSNSGIVEDVSLSADVKGTELESKSKLLGESVLWNRLEGWVEQYKKDIEFWGIGTGPIFTVFRDSDGKVEKVVIDEDEILRRSGLDPLLYNEGEHDLEVLTKVNSRISHAKTLARKMEDGNEVLPGNSSVAKYVVSSEKSGTRSLFQRDTRRHGLTSSIRNFIQEVTLKPAVISKLSRSAILVVCGIFVISVVKRLFIVGDQGQEYTSLEKEMLRRKIKARMDKETNMKGSIEVLDYTEPKIPPIERPQLDKQELLKSITQASKSNGTLALPENLGSQEALPVDFERRIQEIRAMARHARELEKGNSLAENNDHEGERVLNQLSQEKEMIQKFSVVNEHSRKEPPNEGGVQTEDPSGTKIFIPSAVDSKDESGNHIDLASAQNGLSETSKITSMKIPDDTEFPAEDMVDRLSASFHFDAVEVSEQSNTTNERSVTKRFRIISSVEEAREYLSNKHDKGQKNLANEARNIKQVDAALAKPSDEKAVEGTNLRLDSTEKLFDLLTSTSTHNLMHDFEEFSLGKAEDFQSTNRNLETENQGDKQEVDLGASSPLETESSLSSVPTDTEMSQEQNGYCKSSPVSTPSYVSSSCLDSTLDKKQKIPTEENVKGVNETGGGVGVDIPATSGQQSSSSVAEPALSENQGKWIEKNFHELEPIVKKIGVGFRDNYVVAKEKINEDMSLKIEMMELISGQDGNELEWMKDERLREIVFRVRDNELAGRDPFHLLDDEEKLAFFSGLEKKVEDENAKLLNLHEWMHSNIENLDYGAGADLFLALHSILFSEDILFPF